MKKNEPTTSSNPFTTKTASDCFNHILDKSKELFKDIRDVNPIPNPLGNINNLSGLRSENVKNLPMLEDGNNFYIKKDDEKLGLPQAINNLNSPINYHHSPRLSIEHMQGIHGGSISNYGNMNNFQSYHNLGGDFFDHNDLKISRKSSTFSAVPREGYDEYLNNINNSPFRQDLGLNMKKENSSVYSSPNRNFRTRKESFISEEPLKPRSSKTTLIINSENDNNYTKNHK
jgi:hypothetical protein